MAQGKDHFVVVEADMFLAGPDAAHLGLANEDEAGVTVPNSGEDKVLD